ncbi:long-chain-fatty-acid--CoA ligase [Streptomyces rapamycinicus]|uniref:Fatty-acid--CoA ligase n=1 Tax=Streptomyces rapamycinicus (strain ATCC 29253 / DSM 41530 / NRRL 5491 / AYB-994) TaxID=1343740 RepID=A0A3L8RDH7_STRRN|nr:long-chain-fatty-acid--CoA ligase [Streptomyces rapamycinicus]RLV77630.1 fatty-acid--CoA ligase [Streptomyces rapamycinicus NRRL 5491]UTO66937.1 long-chain-fatty-acid--CoA ligase [Streptomyces rapamycinicus]UTP34893.1 long-chain-fatty-acid--CoA ligase [Streptomyces rapamycinicus NRRL 5491]
MYLTQGLHRSLRESPNAPATIFGYRVRTFSDQADRVARFAGALREFGVVDGERVGILSHNSDKYLEALLSVPWANGVVNPVNYRWSPAEIIYSLKESETEILLVDDTFAPVVSELRQGYEGLRVVVYMGDGPPPLEDAVGYEDLIAKTAPLADSVRGGDALAGLFYTGGTTGFPKGVMLSHANILISAFGSQASCPFVVPSGRTLHVAPMFHLADLAMWVAQLMLGGAHVVLPNFDPPAVMAAIDEHRVTNVVLVPSMVQMLVDHPELARFDLSSVRYIVYGAEPITEVLLRRAMSAFPQADFVQCYGMTELAPMATMLSGEDHRQGTRLRSAGRVVAHAEVRVVDQEGNEVPPGTIGEIVVRGGHVMLGYWHKPEATASALWDGWMHTGDGGYMDDDGYLFVADRIKDVIISGGENVYAAEVENAVAKHPAVAACAVVGVPDDRWGERVHAIVVVKPGAQKPTEEQIREHCKGLIAGYKSPRSVEFVDVLPISGTGKIDKRQLSEPYWADSPRNR